MSAELWQTALRFLHIAASAFLFGALLFPVYTRHAGIARRLLLTLAALSLIAGIGWIALMAQSVGGPSTWRQPALMQAIFLRASFGPIWLVHLAISASVLGALCLKGAGRAPSVFISAVQLLSLALFGHSVSLEGAFGPVLIAAHGVHVLAAGAWIGGVFALFCALRTVDPSAARRMTARFSNMAYIAVALVMAAGFVNLRLVAHGWLPDLGTAYGQVIAGKLALVGGLVALAVFNRLYASAPGRRRLFAVSMAIELVAFGAVVLAAAAVAALSPHG